MVRSDSLFCTNQMTSRSNNRPCYENVTLREPTTHIDDHITVRVIGSTLLQFVQFITQALSPSWKICELNSRLCQIQCCITVNYIIIHALPLINCKFNVTCKLATIVSKLTNSMEKFVWIDYKLANFHCRLGL